MRIIIVRNTMIIPVGRQGENEAQRIIWPDIVTSWSKLYGDGVFSFAVKRNGDDTPYPAVVTTENGSLIWVPTNADTANVGFGSCELVYTVGDVIAKSQIWRTETYPSLTGEGETEPPEPYQSWVDQVVAVGAAAQASADAAKADADRATALAAEVAANAAKTAQEASGAEQAKEAAQTAQRLAEEAQGAAETARTAAEAAQAAAETAATDADGAKQAAEAALKATQDAAEEAAQSLEALRTLYQEMQTWAQGVIQDVNAAGSAAVQSVQSAGDTQVQRVTDEGATQTANAKAQADAAAQSASGAAQSAQEAAESAAVYDTVVADVTQLKQDLSDKLPKSPVNWEPWTADEQAAARARMDVENGADFELFVDATLEEEANVFKVVFPKPVRECIYHIWFYNNNGAIVTARTKCFDHTDVNGFYLLKYTSNIKDSHGYVLNGYLRYNGPIMNKSVIGYASDAQAAEWTTDAPGNGNQAFLSYPTATFLTDISGLSVELVDKTHVLNVGATIKVWGR